MKSLIKRFKNWWRRYCLRLAAAEIRDNIDYWKKDLSADEILALENLAHTYELMSNS